MATEFRRNDAITKEEQYLLGTGAGVVLITSPYGGGVASVPLHLGSCRKQRLCWSTNASLFEQGWHIGDRFPTPAKH